MAELSVNEMLANQFEPKRKNRWILEVDGIDAFTLKAFARPNVNNNEIEIHYLNERRYLAGKYEPQSVTLRLYDPLEPSAAQKVYDKLKLLYDPQTGRAGFAATYKEDMVVKMLDPEGGIAEEWTLVGGWFKSSNWGDLDMENADPADIEIEVRYDKAILNF